MEIGEFVPHLIYGFSSNFTNTVANSHYNLQKLIYSFGLLIYGTLL